MHFLFFSQSRPLEYLSIYIGIFLDNIPNTYELEEKFMSNYSEITYKDRIVIETLYNLKKPQAEIARTLGKTPSAINQELKRHDQYADSPIKHRYRYQAHVAQYRAEESKQQFGHFEFDGMESSKSNTLVLTIIERKTRMFFALKLDNKRGETVAQALDQFLYTYGDIVKSMTSDRGKEFINHSVSRVFKAYNVTHYVAHAYSAYERGTNENLNAIFRRHFPKGTDFNPVRQLDLQKASDLMNQRPLQIFKYASTPAREFKNAVNRSRSHSKQTNHGLITIESTQRMYQH